MYGATFPGGRAAFGGYVSVKDAADLAFLIKEFEVMAGRKGRTMVVASADRIAYDVSIGPAYFEVTKLNDGKSIEAEIVPFGELHSHTLGQAMKSGQLFTALDGCGT